MVNDIAKSVIEMIYDKYRSDASYNCVLIEIPDGKRLLFKNGKHTAMVTGYYHNGNVIIYCYSGDGHGAVWNKKVICDISDPDMINKLVKSLDRQLEHVKKGDFLLSSVTP